MKQRLPIPAPAITGLTYESPIGSGGFADVFKYRQAVPKRTVAVKVFLNKFQAGTLEANKFMTEIDTLAEVGHHPNIVSIIGAAISPEGYPYMSMEYCPQSLGKNWRTQPMSLQTVLEIGVLMASALETVHRRGIIHRDIKPANILINELGVPQLSDFGIASNKLSEEDTEQIAMSLPWTAPEIANLQTSGTIASDIFSLGATLYSLLAGRTPFEVDDSKQNVNEQLRKRVIKAIYVNIPRGGIPGIVEEVLNKAMSRNPNDRYGSMQELAMDINQLQEQLQFRQTPIMIPTRVTLDEPDAQVEKFECGHPKPVNRSGELKQSVVQSDKSNRRLSQPMVETSEAICQICNAAPMKKKGASEKRQSPLFWIVLGAVVVGFGLTFLVIKALGV